MMSIYAFRDGRDVAIPYGESKPRMFSPEDKPCLGENPYITRTRNRVMAGFVTWHDGNGFLSIRASVARDRRTHPAILRLRDKARAAERKN